MNFMLLVFLMAILNCQAQNTLVFKESSASPTATLADVSWIEGHWRGEAFGGTAEEIWSPPLGGSMMFVFKLVVEDVTRFYEIGHIREVDGTLLLQLKHFHNDLKGWEEKGETVDFKLVKIEGKRVYFDQFTFEKVNKDEINLFVVIKQDDGSKEEVKFNYVRQL